MEHRGAHVRVPRLRSRRRLLSDCGLATVGSRRTAGVAFTASNPAASANPKPGGGGFDTPPQPYTGVSEGETHQDTMVIHGVRITFGTPLVAFLNTTYIPACCAVNLHVSHTSQSNEGRCTVVQSFGTQDI